MKGSGRQHKRNRQYRIRKKQINKYSKHKEIKKSIQRKKNNNSRSKLLEEWPLYEEKQILPKGPNKFQYWPPTIKSKKFWAFGSPLLKKFQKGQTSIHIPKK